MSVTRWSPSREVESIREIFNRLSSDFEGWPKEWREAEMMPIDVQETDESILVKASMPGIDRDHIEIGLRDRNLHIKGTSREERDETKGTWHRKERKFGVIERSVSLPCTVSADAAEAKLVDGVLEVTLRKEEVTPSTKIEVKGS
jgi:HSP20 family protein